MLARRDGQLVGDQPQRGRVDAEAEVTAADLDVLVPFGLRLQASLPGYYAVQAGEDRGRGHADGPGPLLEAGQPGAVRVQVAEALVRTVDPALPPRIGQGEGAAEGDDPPDVLGVPTGQFQGHLGSIDSKHFRCPGLRSM